MEKLAPSLLGLWNCTDKVGNSLAISQINTELSCDPVGPFAYAYISIHPGGMKADALSMQKTYEQMFIALFIMDRRWK